MVVVITKERPRLMHRSLLSCCFFVSSIGMRLREENEVRR
jgi:hypothetical protein